MPSGRPRCSGVWKASQNPAQVAQPDDKKATSVSWSFPETAMANASPDGVTPAMVGADVALRSPGSCGPIVNGTGVEFGALLVPVSYTHLTLPTNREE